MQFKTFGYIDDAAFVRFKFHIKNGALYSYDLKNFELKAGEIASFHLLRLNYHHALSELETIRKRLAELENQPTPKPSNIINFSDYKRRANKV